MLRTKSSPIGEWLLMTSLRDLSKPDVVHTETEVRAIFDTFVLMRVKRKEPYFDTAEISIGALGMGPDLFRMRGTSVFDLDTSIQILDELAFCIGAHCGQKIVDIYIPSQDIGERIFRRRFTIRSSKKK